MTAAWPRCSFAADAAGDPREGTAPPGDRWFLVEHPGPWPSDALAALPVAGSALAGWAEEAAGRVLLVRRPGRTPAGAARRWFRVDARPGHESVRTGTYADEAELSAAVAAPGDPHGGPLVLVCTHGRHDTCCAVRGRPVAAALAGADAGPVWECSHVGGCRFAPAVVLLPHGYVLGGLSPQGAAAAAAAYRDGHLDAAAVRGRSALPPAVQAAQHHARKATGATGVDALRPVHTAWDDLHDGTVEWHVDLAAPHCTVVLHERLVPTGRPLTCAATAPGALRVFDLVKVT
ncbi:MAG TPA: sucrase ferredoxin [Pseudonocardia sp.]|nr:sucrase ferredoxin [Pseudonocardia sp.]